MSLDAPRCSAHGRFEVAWVDGGMTMTARGVERGAVSAAIRFGSLGLLVIGPPILAWCTPALQAPSMTALVVLAGVAARAAWVHIARYRVFESGVWARVRRRLTIEPPPAVAADYREAPEKPRVVLDGVSLDPTDPPGVSVTSSARLQATGIQRIARLYRVNLLFRSHLVRVETFANARDALALARELRQALGLAACDEPAATEIPFEATPKGVAVGGLLFLAQVLPAVAAIRWARSTDFAEGFATRLAIASSAVALSALAVQALALAFFESLVTEATQETFGIEVDVSPSRRWARMGALGWSVASIGLAVFSWGSNTATGTFRAGRDRLLVVDIGGEPAVVGWVRDERGLALGAFDTKTGARRWRLPTSDVLMDSRERWRPNRDRVREVRRVRAVPSRRDERRGLRYGHRRENLVELFRRHGGSPALRARLHHHAPGAIRGLDSIPRRGHWFEVSARGSGRGRATTRRRAAAVRPRGSHHVLDEQD